MVTYNTVLTLPKDKIETVAKHLDKHKVKNTNQHIILCAKHDNVSFNLFKTGKLVLQGPNKEEIELEKESILSNIFNIKEKIILGFDEVGRSELTGPFVICGLLGYNEELMELRDSKKTSDIENAKQKADKQALGYMTLTLNPRFVDMLRGKEINLNKMESEFIAATKSFIDKLDLNIETIVDGQALNKDLNLKEIKFIKKADDTVPVVAAASIVAKSVRDNSKNDDKRKTWNVK